MRLMRTVGAALLLTIGIPVLLAGGTLWLAANHRDDGGAFAGSVERLDTPGHALVVPDLDALLRREAPFVRTGRTRLRLTARTATGPAFLGIGPAADTARYLAPVPHARVDRVSVTRGPLPVRMAAATPSRPAATLAPPGTRTFWQDSAVGTLDLDPRQFRDRSLSLVVMRPDGTAGVGADVRVEVRPGWLDPAMWGLLASGTLLVVVAAIVLTRPVRPREIVFVVAPEQVPVLAARLGVPTLDPVTDSAPARTAGTAGAVPPVRRAGTTGPGARLAGGLVDPAEPVGPAVGSGGVRSGPPSPQPGYGPAGRPATLAELLGAKERRSDSNCAEMIASGPAVTPALPARVAPTTWPPDAHPAHPPRPVWPTHTPERAGPAPWPVPHPAASPIPSQLPVPSPLRPGSPPAGPPRSRVAEPAGSRVTAPVVPRSAPPAEPARLRRSVPAGPGRAPDAIGADSDAGDGNAAGDRLGEKRAGVGRHHAVEPVLPLRPDATRSAATRENMGRNRWWTLLRRNRAGKPADRA